METRLGKKTLLYRRLWVRFLFKISYDIAISNPNFKSWFHVVTGYIKCKRVLTVNRRQWGVWPKTVSRLYGRGRGECSRSKCPTDLFSYLIPTTHPLPGRPSVSILSGRSRLYACVIISTCTRITRICIHTLYTYHYARRSVRRFNCEKNVNITAVIKIWCEKKKSVPTQYTTTVYMSACELNKIAVEALWVNNDFL